MPRRARGVVGRRSEYLEPRRLVQLGGLGAGIGHGHSLAANLEADHELVLALGRLADGDRELAVLTTDLAVEPEHVPEVAVAALIERPEQSDARLDRGHGSTPGELGGHRQ